MGQDVIRAMLRSLILEAVSCWKHVCLQVHVLISLSLTPVHGVLLLPGTPVLESQLASGNLLMLESST